MEFLYYHEVEDIVLKNLENTSYILKYWSEELTVLAFDRYKFFNNESEIIELILDLDLLFKNIENGEALNIITENTEFLDLKIGFINFYEFLMERCEGEAVDILFNATNEPDILYFDGFDYYLLNKKEADKKALTEFNELCPTDILAIAENYL